jgi:murein DD-endopeptidase MepM/ murein hydrolase activator NlpD
VPARPVTTKRLAGWTLMLIPQTAGVVRSYELRRWHMRSAVVVGLLVLGATLGGGMLLGARDGEEELAAMDVQLWNAEMTATALDDTLQATRLASALAAMTPASARGSSPAASAPRRRAAASSSSMTVAPGVLLPVLGRISSGFSYSRRHPLLMIRRPHLGIDLGAPAGTRIRTPADGEVVRVERQLGYGLLVEIDHGNGVRTRYGHCRSSLVSVGDPVMQGEPIATVGSSGLSTGPHLHYEVVVNGRRIDPLRYRFPVPATAAAILNTAGGHVADTSGTAAAKN